MSNNEEVLEMGKKEMGFWKELFTSPAKIIVAFVVSALLWHYVIGPELDADASTTTQQLREPTCGSEGACATSAARKFRKGKIRHNLNGVPVRQAFTKPKKSRRIIAHKFARRNHRVFAGREPALRSGPGGLCTSDTRQCGFEWYQDAVTQNCVPIGPVYAGGKGRCTEGWNRPFTPVATRKKVQVAGCLGQAVLSFTAKKNWQKAAAMPGALETCWRLVD